MTKLSVNINKFATLRNARGGNNPNILEAAKNCENYGAQGITVHPRPDQRHIRQQDIFDLKPIIKTEFNIEGFPDKRFIDLVLQIKPTQATLVPDAPNVLTSNAGWNTVKSHEVLKEVVQQLKEAGIRVSIFVDPIEEMIYGAAEVGADRIELYTEQYAIEYINDKEKAITPYATCAQLAKNIGLGVNAGHDLSLENLVFLKKNIPFLDEVSIGHALICDAICFGLENVIPMYLRCLDEQN